MPSLDAAMNKLKPVLRVIGRASRATGVVVILGALGLLLGKWLADKGMATPDWAKTVMTTGFLLATMDKAIAQALILGRWVKSGVGDGLATFSTFFFVTFVTGVAAALVIDGKGSDVKAPTSVIAQVVPRQLAAPPIVFVNVPSGTVTPSSSDENVFLVPFYKEAGGCTTESSWFKKGAKLSGSTRRFISKLAEGFLRCARPETPVALEVRGFASSQPFLRCAGKETSLNLEIANARAKAVEQAFLAAIPEDRMNEVKVTATPWTSIESMEAERRWHDREGTEYSKERAILTRRAEITLTSGGGCQVLPRTEGSRPSQTAINTDQASRG